GDPLNHASTSFRDFGTARAGGGPPRGSVRDVGDAGVRLHAPRGHDLYLHAPGLDIARDRDGQEGVRRVGEAAGDRDQGDVDVDRTDADDHAGEAVGGLGARGDEARGPDPDVVAGAGG